MWIINDLSNTWFSIALCFGLSINLKKRFILQKQRQKQFKWNDAGETVGLMGSGGAER